MVVGEDELPPALREKVEEYLTRTGAQEAYLELPGSPREGGASSSAVGPAAKEEETKVEEDSVVTELEQTGRGGHCGRQEEGCEEGY